MRRDGFLNGTTSAAGILAITIALAMALLATGCGSETSSPSSSSQSAASQATSVEQAKLSSWSQGSASLKKLTDFVEAATDEASSNYIPPEDRIAVFDLDGTLMCETYPWCFEYMVFADYALNNPDYQAPEDIAAVAKEIKAPHGARSPTA